MSEKEAGVYRVTEIIGTSTKSWEEAARNAVEAAAKSLRDLRVAEVSKLDMKIENGKVVAYRARVSLSFKYEAS
jgi:dodecin